MFAGWDNYDIQETRRIAREEGREEGRDERERQIVIGMKSEGLSDAAIARAAKLPIEKVREICSEAYPANS